MRSILEGVDIENSYLFKGAEKRSPIHLEIFFYLISSDAFFVITSEGNGLKLVAFVFLSAHAKRVRSLLIGLRSVL